ncbi:MAG: zonular occludens toxin domain-containing protein, partial [Methylotenera sp.]|nr:zonular occludens toxin domain-containing protein [Methylotenera sp.]
MINLITGLPGSGKTLFTLKTVNDLAIKDNRTVYYHGIPDLILPWVLMDKPEDWINLPNGSIIVIDECQSTFRPRAASTKPPAYISEFETHRHKGLDFFLLTQHPMLIDGNIRRLSGRHFHAVRFYGFNKSTVHEFQQVRENVDKNTAGSIANQFFFPKEVFNWYKSADTHTIKKRLPMRLFMIIALPIFFVAILF